MKPLLLNASGGERVTVEVEGSDYEECVTASMVKLRDVLPDTRIVRNMEEADEHDWYFDASDCRLTPGGRLVGRFTFTRRWADDTE